MIIAVLDTACCSTASHVYLALHCLNATWHAALSATKSAADSTACKHNVKVQVALHASARMRAVVKACVHASILHA